MGGEVSTTDVEKQPSVNISIHGVDPRTIALLLLLQPQQPHARCCGASCLLHDRGPGCLCTVPASPLTDRVHGTLQALSRRLADTEDFPDITELNLDSLIDTPADTSASTPETP